MRTEWNDGELTRVFTFNSRFPTWTRGFYLCFSFHYPFTESFLMTRSPVNSLLVEGFVLVFAFWKKDRFSVTYFFTGRGQGERWGTVGSGRQQRGSPRLQINDFSVFLTSDRDLIRGRRSMCATCSPNAWDAWRNSTLLRVRKRTHVARGVAEEDRRLRWRDLRTVSVDTQLQDRSMVARMCRLVSFLKWSF